MFTTKPPSSPSTAQSRDQHPAATAAYLSDLLNGMTGMARGSGHGLLAYLLGVAQHEAARLAKKG